MLNFACKPDVLLFELYLLELGIHGVHVFTTNIYIFTNYIYVQEVGELEEAEAHCLRLLDYGAPSKERAKALLREIRALQVSSAVLHSGSLGSFRVDSGSQKSPQTDGRCVLHE